MGVIWLAGTCEQHGNAEPSHSVAWCRAYISHGQICHLWPYLIFESCDHAHMSSVALEAITWH